VGNGSGPGPDLPSICQVGRGFKRAPGVTRTPDRRIRNPLLYPAELRAQIALQYVAAKRRKSSGSLNG
jgi:hypothetical protein